MTEFEKNNNGTLVIMIKYTMENQKSKTQIHYKGSCTAYDLDRAILSIIATLSSYREAEQKRLGVERTDIHYGGDPSDMDFSEYFKP